MMHNPFQSYQTDPTLAAYAGMVNPFSSPYTGMQNPVTNPATLNPLTSALGVSCPVGGLSQLGQTGYAGIPNFGNIHPQQLQLASLLTPQASSPQLFGQSPWQNPYAVSSFQNPWITGGLQNPLLTAGLQNPLLSAGLQNPLLNPILAQQQFGLQPLQAHVPYQQIGQGMFGLQGSPYASQVSPYGSQVSPYAQIGSPFGQQGSPYGQIGSPLAPQSWVGQAGPFGGVPAFGQIHPLLAQQLAARAFHAPGISPWTGF